MVDVTSMNEADWGPEQTATPPIGSIFILKLYKHNIPSVASKDFRYKLINISPSPYGDELNLELWDHRAQRWQQNHSWRVVEGVTFRVLVGSTAPVSIAKAGCHCRKCREYFPFGEPNQTDGTLICWNCRNYPHYRG